MIFNNRLEDRINTIEINNKHLGIQLQELKFKSENTVLANVGEEVGDLLITDISVEYQKFIGYEYVYYVFDRRANKKRIVSNREMKMAKLEKFSDLENKTSKITRSDIFGEDTEVCVKQNEPTSVKIKNLLRDAIDYKDYIEMKQEILTLKVQASKIRQEIHNLKNKAK